MSTNLSDHIPALKYKDLDTQTFSSGNTKTVTDPRVKPSSVIIIMHTSVPAGRWGITTLSDGSFVITSSASENGATFEYLIL